MTIYLPRPIGYRRTQALKKSFRVQDLAQRTRDTLDGAA